jgi:uncharacterized protein (TIGR02145 family)
MGSRSPKARAVVLAALLLVAVTVGAGIAWRTQFMAPDATRWPDFVDARDGNRYPVVRIGTQVWMARNLAYATGRSWCYEDRAEICRERGRLYDWETAVHACPPKWHLPSDEELFALQRAVGDDSAPLKSAEMGGTDATGFAARANGFREPDGHFMNLDVEATLWSATASGPDTAFKRWLPANSHEILRHDRPKGLGYGVRCLAD